MEELAIAKHSDLSNGKKDAKLRRKPRKRLLFAAMNVTMTPDNLIMEIQLKLRRKP